MGTPALWLGGALAICLGLFAAGVVSRHAAEVKGARSEGIAIGKVESAEAALEAAAETAAAERAAEADTPQLPDKAAIIALCKRSASCKERHLLK